MDTIARWHGYMETGDAAALDALLAEDAVFESPAVHTPQRAARSRPSICWRPIGC